MNCIGEANWSCPIHVNLRYATSVHDGDTVYADWFDPEDILTQETAQEIVTKINPDAVLYHENQGHYHTTWLVRTISACRESYLHCRDNDIVAVQGGKYGYTADDIQSLESEFVKVVKSTEIFHPSNLNIFLVAMYREFDTVPTYCETIDHVKSNS